MNYTIEKFGIFAIRVKIANSTSRSSENRKNVEKGKQTCSSIRYVGYITAKFHKKYSQ